MLGISVDSRFTLNAFATSLGGVPFPLLADFHPKGEVARAYGVYNQERGISNRAVVIVDREGVVRWKKAYELATVPDVEEILRALPGR